MKELHIPADHPEYQALRVIFLRLREQAVQSKYAVSSGPVFADVYQYENLTWTTSPTRFFDCLRIPNLGIMVSSQSSRIGEYPTLNMLLKSEDQKINEVLEILTHLSTAIGDN